MKKDEYMDGFDLYKETLRQLGVDIEQLPLGELQSSYERYQSNLIKEEFDNGKIIKPLLEQLQD
jgi:hypothetical protein